MEKIFYSIGAIVDLMGEKCRVLRSYDNYEFDLESLDLTDENGEAAFYGRVSGEVLS